MVLYGIEHMVWLILGVLCTNGVRHNFVVEIEWHPFMSNAFALNSKELVILCPMVSTSEINQRLAVFLVYLYVIMRVINGRR